MKKVKEMLMSIHLLDKTDKCTPMDVKKQSEWKCGVRMMLYMMMFREWVDRTSEAQNRIRQMNRAMKAENKRTHDLAKASRERVSQFLKEQGKCTEVSIPHIPQSNKLLTIQMKVSPS